MRTPIINRLFLVCLFACFSHATEPAFLVEPYLQMGDAPSLAGSDSLVVMWHTLDADDTWDVQTKKSGGSGWSPAVAGTSTRVGVRTIEPHRVYRAALRNLEAGKEFDYRVRKNSQSVFEARARARKNKDQPYRFVVFGDCAAGTPEQREVAYQAYQAKPDFVFIPGDIVYSNGRISEYRTKYFPVYNAAKASPAEGAPLIRSTLFIAAPGNHDIARPDVGLRPDSLAYFLYWSQPLNGPMTKVGNPSTPVMVGPEEDRTAFLTAAGAAYPRMANFSFDYGNAHWTVLDANANVDWTAESLRDWVASDLAAAKGATWRFVSFHHPGFNSSIHHFGDQWMRRLSGVFEAGGVDVVFGGHVHNYQRSFPLKFQSKPAADKPKNFADGDWTLDKKFDGAKRTKADGVIYLVTGAGGARLYDPEQQDNPSSWQPFTDKFISKVNSFTVVDTAGSKLSFRQISKDGEEVDRFVLTK